MARTKGLRARAFSIIYSRTSYSCRSVATRPASFKWKMWVTNHWVTLAVTANSMHTKLLGIFSFHCKFYTHKNYWVSLVHAPFCSALAGLLINYAKSIHGIYALICTYLRWAWQRRKTKDLLEQGGGWGQKVKLWCESSRKWGGWGHKECELMRSIGLSCALVSAKKVWGNIETWFNTECGLSTRMCVCECVWV